MFPELGYWMPTRDGDPRAVALYERHYSVDSKADHHHGIVGPGEKMVLLTTGCDALWVWHLVQNPENRLNRRKDHQFTQLAGGYWGGQEGVMCSVFRNEGPLLSSLLVIEAMELAWQRWPGKRLFTYVWDAKVKSANPGYCFKVAGWRFCGRNKDGRLSILECQQAWGVHEGVAR